MIKYIVYNIETGEILRSGGSSKRNLALQVKSDKEALLIGLTANDVTQKVLFDGLDQRGQPINPRIVEKQKVAK